MHHFKIGPFTSTDFFLYTDYTVKKYDIGTAILIAGKDEETAHECSKRILGDRASHTGSIMPRDAIETWFTRPYPEDGYFNFMTPCINALHLLGSIKFESAIVITDGTKVLSFHIETSEEGKRRVLASEADESGGYESLPAGFRFTAHWLTRLIIAQY